MTTFLVSIEDVLRLLIVLFDISREKEAFQELKLPRSLVSVPEVNKRILIIDRFGRYKFDQTKKY